MGDGYDRFENEGGGGGSFVMGLLTGTVLGAGLGMLFAPKSGSELRGQLSEQAGNLKNTASQGVRKATQVASDLADRGRDYVDKARDAVSRGTDEAQRYVEKARDAVSRGTDEAQRYVKEATSTPPSSSTYSSGPTSRS
jgi:gas vesicle protein